MRELSKSYAFKDKKRTIKKVTMEYFVLDRYRAEQLIKAGAKSNNGPWIAHSKNVAISAERISKRTSHMNSEKAYIFGLLHDIGKRDPDAQYRHPIVGYNFMIDLGEIEVAQICLTHPFTLQNANETLGYAAFSDSDLLQINRTLSSVEYSDYDRLIQLCDSIALPEGIVLLEKRLVDVHLRHGFNEYSVDRWKKLFDLKAYFESIVGRSIYDLFPESKDLTFNYDY